MIGWLLLVRFALFFFSPLRCFSALFFFFLSVRVNRGNWLTDALRYRPRHHGDRAFRHRVRLPPRRGHGPRRHQHHQQGDHGRVLLLKIAVDSHSSCFLLVSCFRATTHMKANSRVFTREILVHKGIIIPRCLRHGFSHIFCDG